MQAGVKAYGAGQDFLEQVPFDGPILVITGPTFTKLVDDASCDTADLTSLDAICLTFTCWRGLMFRDQV